MADYLKDTAGRDYLSADNQPVGHGTKILIPNGYGQDVPGTMLFGHATTDK